MLVVGAVLAAGEGTRLGRPKANLVIDNVRLVDRAVATLLDAGCARALVVVRDGVEVTSGLSVMNPEPSLGMRGSLELAVHAAADADALVVTLVDTPCVDAQAVRVTMGAWRPGRVALAVYDGLRGHPIVMSIEMWQRALGMAGPDEGARRFLKAHPEVIDEVALSGPYMDIDTEADLKAWRRLSGQPAPS